jgi:hypothetical protein
MICRFLEALSGPTAPLTVALSGGFLGIRRLNRDVQGSLGEVGYGKSVQEIIVLARYMVDSKGLQASVSVGLWDKFCKRHQAKLTVRAGESLSPVRLAVSDPEIIDQYFNLLETTLVENGLLDKPMQIFNADETEMPLGNKAGKIVPRKGEKHTYVATSGDKNQITVLACTNAVGFAMPPLVIFD